jgi:hypothetical protein
MAEIIDFRIDDVVRLRKPHPCGGFEWSVYRLGADIGLQCRTCGHYVMLPRTTLEKRLKRFVARGPDPAPEPEQTPRVP